MGENEPHTTPQAAAQREVSRASMHWDTTATRMPGSPAPAASVRARLDGQRAKARQHPWRPKLWRAGGAGILAGVAAGVLTVLGEGGPWWALGYGLAVTVMVTASAGLWSVRDRFGYDTVGRELREQVRLEERVAASLEPLETAGWVLLHDRLIAAHRVPHLLIGPAGVVLIYPYTLGRHAIARYRARRARAGLQPDRLGARRAAVDAASASATAPDRYHHSGERVPPRGGTDRGLLGTRRAWCAPATAPHPRRLDDAHLRLLRRRPPTCRPTLHPHATRRIRRHRTAPTHRADHGDTR